MQGEIMVAEVMDRAERLRVWSARQSRDAEWTALKQWWKAEEKLRAAEGKAEIQAALEYRSKTAGLYQEALARAWPKWRRVQQEMQARRRGKVTS